MTTIENVSRCCWVPKIDPLGYIGEPTTQILAMAEATVTAPIGSKLRWTMNSGWTSRTGIVTKKGLLEVKRETGGIPDEGLGKVLYRSVSAWISALPEEGCVVVVKKDTRPKIVQLATKPFDPAATDGEKVYELCKRFRAHARCYWNHYTQINITISKGQNKLYAVIGGVPTQITYRIGGETDENHSFVFTIVNLDTGRSYRDFQELGVDRTAEGGPNLWIVWKGQRVMLTL